AAGAPPAVSTANEQRAVRPESHRHAPGAEPLLERVAGPLVVAIHLLQARAHDDAVCLVADEELLLERPNLAAGQVAVEAGRGLTHLRVREQDARRVELRDAPGLGHHPAVGLGHHWSVAEVPGLLLLVPPEAVRVADEPADGQALQPARPI